MRTSWLHSISLHDALPICYRDSHLLYERDSDLKRVPPAHWVMMGLTGNGSYNSEDYTFTYRFRTYEQRQNANLVQIRQRIADYGFWGYLEFLNRKQQIGRAHV